MKNKSIPMLLLFLSVSLMMNAQQETKSKSDCGCGFRSINQAGLLEGSAGSSFNVQTINGFYTRTWFVGAGLGLDRYRFRTVPVFLDLRKDLFKKWNTPFLYGDIGVHVPWVRDSEKAEWGRSDFKTGLYYDAGIGYKMNIGKNRGLLFSGGISLKKMREIRSFDVVCVTQPCPAQTERYEFSMKRFSLKAGIQL